MHEYDTALKSLFNSSSNSLLKKFAGAKAVRWLNVEFPEVKQPRVDLLGRLANGKLIHLEFQRHNDRDMHLRMAEYALYIYRKYRQFPLQIVIYFGGARMSMHDELSGPHQSFRFTIVDLQRLDAEPFLNSPLIADNILAVLFHLRNSKAAIKTILESIERLEGEKRVQALKHLLILSGVRKFTANVAKQVAQRPALNDLLDHQIFGPVIRRSLEQGQRGILQRMIEKRFGSIPPWAQQRLDELSTAQLEKLADGVLEAQNLNQLFSL